MNTPGARDLVIDSVTGVDLTLPIAGAGARCYAFVIDWLIRAILFSAWYGIAALIYNGRWSFAAPLSPDTRWFVFVVATMFSMVAMSWQLSLLLLFIIPVYVASARKLGPAIQVASRSRQERLAQLNSQLEEMLFGSALIKAYSLGDHMLNRFRPKIQEHRKLATQSGAVHPVEERPCRGTPQIALRRPLKQGDRQ